jgi:hypothetical protein
MCKETYKSDPAQHKKLIIHAPAADIKSMKPDHIMQITPAIPLVSKTKVNKN